MYPEKLGTAKHESWKANELFLDPQRMAKGFIMHDYSIGMHRQSFYEINIVMKGGGMHYFGDRRISAEAGDVFIIPPDMSHGYAGCEGFDVYHLILSPRYLEKNSAELMLLPAFPSLFHLEPTLRVRSNTDLHLKLDRERLDRLSPLLKSIEEHSKKDSAENFIICASEAMIAIAILCSAYKNVLHTDNTDRDFLKSLSLIYERYSERISVERLCAVAKMSKSSYMAKFKKATGATPGELLLSRRIAAAKTLLAESSDSVFDISQAVGFYDASHFIKAFKKAEGVSPTEYRSGYRSMS